MTTVSQKCALCITERVAELRSFLEALASRIGGRFRTGRFPAAKNGQVFFGASSEAGEDAWEA